MTIPIAAPMTTTTTTATAATRALGRTGARVMPVSLGGEGVLRTSGRAAEAVPVILEALRLGVTYCDTAPAYQQSQDGAFRSTTCSAPSTRPTPGIGPSYRRLWRRRGVGVWASLA
jgi:hypothetical protein